ncbi:hypothetical protein [Archangium violaceum]|nr:hypothetical protein [Archangium violaceum]
MDSMKRTPAKERGTGESCVLTDARAQVIEAELAAERSAAGGAA